MDLQNKKIVVFGGSGFIGTQVVQRLADAGAQVVIPCRSAEQAKHLQPLGDVGQVVLIQANVLDLTTIPPLLNGAYGVVNLIGILFEKGNATFEHMHTEVPKTIAAAAKEQGVERFVQISALGADNDSDSKYARTKAGGETAVKQHFAQSTILRPSIVFGPEDNFFNMFAQMAQYSPALPLIGGGKTKFQPVYVENVADAVIKGIVDASTAGKTYELAGPQVYTFKEILQFILKTTGRKRCLVPLPFGCAKFKAMFLQHLPKPPLTPDQVTLLKYDNVKAADSLGLKELGIERHSVEGIVPQYLEQYKVGGLSKFQ